VIPGGLGWKTGGRKKATPNKKTKLYLQRLPAARHLLAVMQSSDVAIDQRLRAAALAAPFCHVKPTDLGPKIIEVVRNAVDPDRNRALELTLKKFNGGISDAEAAELAALKAETVSWRMMHLRLRSGGYSNSP
jgi:hypothetical protein